MTTLLLPLWVIKMLLVRLRSFSLNQMLDYEFPLNKFVRPDISSRWLKLFTYYWVTTKFSKMQMKCLL